MFFEEIGVAGVSSGPTSYYEGLSRGINPPNVTVSALGCSLSYSSERDIEFALTGILGESRFVEEPTWLLIAAKLIRTVTAWSYLLESLQRPQSQL
ncbi:MAG: hypothetical protein Aurels2KO_04210 [Aureliella sp.]